MRARPRTLVLVYLALATLLSSVWYFFIIRSGSLHGGADWAFYLMWSPGIAALATRLVLQRNLRGFGWLPGRPRDLAIAYLLPIAVALPVYGLVWATGLSGTSFAFLPKLGLGRTPEGNVPLALLFFCVAGPLLSLTRAAGEELGWRGLLVPELRRWLAESGRGDLAIFHRVALASGVAWSLYHYPVLLFADYNKGMPWWVSLPAFTLLVFTGSYAFAWLALRSGSFWPAALLHATHNLFIQVFFDRATVPGDWTLYITSEFGFGLPLTYGLVAWLTVRDVGRNGLPSIG